MNSRRSFKNASHKEAEPIIDEFFDKGRRKLTRLRDFSNTVTSGGRFISPNRIKREQLRVDIPPDEEDSNRSRTRDIQTENVLPPDQPMSTPYSTTWIKISRRWLNSILQLRVTRSEFKPYRPYQTPDDSRTRGTGFIINIEEGFVLTNAHVVKDAINIVARSPELGETDIPINLYSISKERDIALCKLTQEGIEMITRHLDDPKILNVKFADDLFVQATDEVLTIGYPLGDEVKFTTGVISGFYRGKDNNGKNIEDVVERDPTYLQITAALNPGNSGGALFNREGKVIGVNAAGFLFAQNVGYAIRSRIVMSLLPSLLSNEGQPVTIPNFAFRWSPTNEALFKSNGKILSESCYRPVIYNSIPGEVLVNGGIFLRKIFPDSVLPSSLEGAVIISILYYDNFLDNPDSFDPTSNLETDGEGPVITAQFDYHGSVNLYTTDGKLLIDRKLKISEMIDLIPYPSNLTLICFRGAGSEDSCPYFQVGIEYQSNNVYRLQYAQPILRPFDFEILAGLCIMELLVDHTEDLFKLRCYYIKDENRYKPRLVICQVFPNTEASRTTSIEQGKLLDTLNGTPVRTLNELREQIQKIKNDQFITFVTDAKAPLVIETEKAKREDQGVLRTFKISADYNSLNS